MPSNGKVIGKLVAQLDLQTGGFMKSTTGVNKAIRQVRSNLKTLDKFYKASGDEMGRLNSKLDQSKVLMDQYKEKVKQLKTELNDLKPNTQAFVKQQNQIRRTEADMKQLEAEMKSYRKQMLYVSSDLDKVNSKYKSQKTALEAIKNMYGATGNKVKEFNTEQKLIKANIDRNNNALKYEREILERVRKELGFTSSEYKEQAAKIRTLKAENTRLSESYKQVGREAKIASLNQQSMNTRMGRSVQFMKQNKAGLIDIRNSLMGLTAAAVGVAYPMARAMGGAVRATVQWEDALSNVAKTTNASQKEMNGYSDSIRQMAKQMPESQSEIANTMALAAQLGIEGGKNLKDFTKIATQMGVATDMSAEQASEAMAKFANATGKPDSDYRRLGSTVVQLGNNMAAQESNIMEFAKRLAGTGTVVGVSQKDILALSSAMASVGISAEAGGSAMSKVLTKMNNAVQNGGKELEGFAKIAGKSGQEFANIWKKDPYEALQLFENGLNDQTKAGKNTKAMLKDLGITEIRETDTVLRLANGHEQLDNARKNANKGYKEGNALSKEAETKYKTLGNQMKIFMNHVRDLGISLGEVLAPMLIAVMKALTPMIDALAHAPKPIKAFVVALALIPVAAVPVLGTLAAITGAMGLVGQSMLTAEKAAKSSAKGMGLYRNAMLMLTNPIQGTKKALTSLPGLFGRTGKGILKTIKPTRLLSLGLRGLSAAFRFLTGPIGLALTAITLLWKGFKYAYDNVKWFRDGINGLGTTIKTFAGGIAGVGVKAVEGIGNAFKTAGGWIKDHFIKQYKASEQQVQNSNDIFSKVARQADTEFKGIFNTLAKANKKATDTTKVLEKGVSEGTKKALTNFVNYSEQSDKILAKVKQNHGDITEEETQKLLSIQQKSTDDLLKEFGNRAKRQEEIQKEVFEKNSGLTAKQEQDILKRTEKNFKQSEKNLKDINDRIQQLVQKNAKDGNLSEKEMEELNKLYDEQRKIAVGTLSQTHKEQKRILARMSANREAYSMKEAQSLVKESIKARDAAKAENKKAYNQEVDHINEMVGLSKEEKTKMLENAKDRYDKSNKAADDAHKETLDNLKKSNKNIENEMDLSNGKMYTKAQQWWNNFSDAFIGYFKGLGESWKKHWDQMIDDIASVDWSGIWDGIKNTGSNIGEWFSDKGRGFATNFKQSWNDAIKLGGSIWSWITNTGAGMGTWFSNKGHEWYTNFITRWNNTQNAMGDIWSGIKEKGSGIGSWFAQKGASAWINFKGKWESAEQTTGDIWSVVKSTGSTIGSWFGSKGSSSWTNFKNKWGIGAADGSLWTSLISGLQNHWSSISGFFSGIGTKMWNMLKTGWNLIVNGQAGQLFTSLIAKLGATWGSIKSWFYTKGAQMLTAVVSGWKSLSATATATFSVLWQNTKKIWAKIWGTIRYYSGLAASWVYKKWQSIKNFTVTFFTSAWTIAKNIWKGITNTIKYWTGLIWNRIKSVFTWIRDKVKSSFISAWNTTKRIWKGIKGTIQYWTQAIWNRIKAVFNWIKNYIKNALNSVWNTTKRIWKGIKGTIQYWTQAIWNRIKSIYNNIKNFIRNTLNKIWDITKRIWKGMRNTIAYWLNSMYSKVKSSWTNIKNKTAQMAQAAWDAVKDKFKGMYNSAKYWVDEIGNYITNAKKWMKNKAISLGKSVANGAIWGLNKMIGGINKISKAITSKKLMEKIPELSTGTVKGKPKSNRKGQLRQATPAIVNDKGKGNGRGSKGHQEVIQRKDGSMYAPQGKNVLVNLKKGDIVHSGRDTQTMQDNGIIPRFASGTKKKKNMLQAAGDAFTNFTDKAKSLGGKAKDGIGATAKKTKDLASSVTDTVVEKTKAGVSKGKEIAGKVKDSIDGILENVEDWMDKPKSLVNTIMDKIGISFGDGDNTTIQMAELAYDKLKSALVDKVKEWFEESFGGGGGYNPFANNSKFQWVRGWSPTGHAGIDYGASVGTPIPSPIDGKVIKSWKSPFGGGNETQIWDGSKYTHIFMHQVDGGRKVKAGDKVHQGQIIGLTGDTGNSSGPHLHWQVNKGKGYLYNHPDSIDPLKWAKEAAKAGGKSGVNKKASAWSGDIRRAAKQMHVSVSSGDVSRIVSLIQHESGGDAGVTQGNIGDINNRQGNPAKGLLQYIPQTFAKYAVKGHKNIWSGYDQLLAFFNNKYWRSQFNPMGGWSPNGPRRYAHGGLIKKHGLYEAGEGNRPEMVLPLTNTNRSIELMERAKTFMGIKDKEVNVNNYNDNTSLEEKLDRNNALLEKLIQVVIAKELKVDAKSLANSTNKELGNQYQSRSYSRGGH